jgi:hypothetical protein
MLLWPEKRICYEMWQFAASSRQEGRVWGNLFGRFLPVREEAAAQFAANIQPAGI